MHIYRADLRDMAACLNLDGNYETDFVWQVTQQEQDEEIVTHFRQVRLPRSMRVRYPAWGEELLQHQERGDLLLVASEAAELRGYIDQQILPDQGLAWIHHLIVTPAHRRTGIGHELLQRALQDGRHQGMIQVMCTVQSKNHPAISFLLRHGFKFCGYNERFYRNADIALYFACGL
ncbi:MAG TPA: GNAT family N-acetyltransferase [Anaerolineae bacterium]